MRPVNSRMTEPWPTEIRQAKDGRTLRVAFDDGHTFVLDAEYLRVESPSAEVKGHGPGQEQLVPGKRNVTIIRLEPVGSYAVRIIFSDGHSTGLFTWPYLWKLGVEHTSIWNDYLAKLEAAGLSRG